ncbi:uncharacterized protein LOC142345493 isoform X3 [Convolutriloba macropyga]
MQFLEMSSLIEVCVLAVIIALTSQLVSDVDGFCAPDTGTITGADGLCFYFGRNRLNWTDADAECKRRGGQLYEPKSLEEVKHVRRNFGMQSKEK